MDYERGWFQLLETAFDLKPESLRRKLLMFNASTFHAVGHEAPLSARSIRGWNTQESAVPSSRTAKFILAFLDYYQSEIKNKSSAQKLQTFLYDRAIILNTDQSPRLTDPLSLCAGSEIKQTFYRPEERDQVTGIYRLVRFNSDLTCMCADIVELAEEHQSLRMRLINENGYFYQGQIFQSPHILHAILVNPTPRFPSLGYSVRFLMFQRLLKEVKDTVAGIMLRSSNSAISPISSPVVLDRFHAEKRLRALNLSEKFERLNVGENLSVSDHQRLKEEGVLGRIDPKDNRYKMYERILKNEKNKWIKPIETPPRGHIKKVLSS